MKKLLLALSVFILASLFNAPSALSQCRPLEGDVFVFAHNGVKANGNAFSALVHFFITSVNESGGTFGVRGLLNERGIGVVPILSFVHSFTWIDSCTAHWDKPTFIADFSDDGRFVGFATFDSDQTGGTAFRSR